jgi:hypothetical protein
MTKTREELIARALRKLGVVGAGQTPSAEDSAAVDEEIEPVMADLAVRGVYAWGDPDEIDDEAFVHLATILGNSVANDFGKPEDDAKREYAEMRLKLLDVKTLSGQPQKVDYY